MTPQQQITRLAGNGGMYIGEVRYIGSVRVVRFENAYMVYWNGGNVSKVAYRRMSENEHARAVVRLCDMLSAAFAQEGAA